MRAAKSWLSAARGCHSPNGRLAFDSDGIRIHAVLHSNGPVAGKPGAVLLHGFRSNCRELEGLAAALAEYGWAALCVDMRGCGMSEGHPDDVNGYVRDALTALNYLLFRGADADRLFLVGQSLGGSVAITCAAADRRAAGVAALHPSCEYDLGAFNPPLGHPDVRHPLESVARLSPRPLLIIAGEADLVLPCSRARELYEAAGAPKRMLEVKDGTHAIEDTEAYVLGWLLAGAPHV